MPAYIRKEPTLALLRKIPDIPGWGPRDLLELYPRFRALLGRAPHKKLLSVLKYAAYLVLLLNIGSLPFVWHIRVFWPILAARLDSYLLRLKFAFASKKERVRALTAWAENLSPVGVNPFEFSTVYTRWASIDDIDVFGMHLSNSSYAKALDTARVHVLIECFPTWGRSGGHMALGATHYHFIREIPPLARYEVRLTIGAWDHKWLYIVARYVTRPTRRRHARTSPKSTSSPPTPINNPPAQNGSASVEHAVAALVQADSDNLDNGTGTRRAPIVEADGAILHCVAVSQICFKAGRITIPPPIVLASEGFTKPYGDEETMDGIGDNAKANANVYTHTNPPPNWIKSQSIRVSPQGSMEAFQAFLRGGWREVPEGERWWEDALGGSVERKRQTNLQVLNALKQNLEQTRTLRQ